jgi:anti-sigma B factor antagonist
MPTAVQRLAVAVERFADIPIVRLAGELDVVSVGRLRAVIDELLLGSGSVVIDLRGLTFIDSAGLGALVRAHKKTRVLQGELTCVCLPESHAGRLIRITGLDRVLRISASLEGFRRPPGP